MKKQLLLTLIISFTISALIGQQLDGMFEVDDYPFHENVDSIIMTEYFINEYADDEPLLIEKYDGKEIPLHSARYTKLVYESDLRYTTKSYLHNELKETQTIEFNKDGAPVYFRNLSELDKAMNEEKRFTYDEKGRLIKVERAGYDMLAYEDGDTTLRNTVAFEVSYNDKNLIESGSASMEMGMAMDFKTETVNDTIKYWAEMKMSGPMAEMMEERLGANNDNMKDYIMYVIYNEKTGMYQSTEKGMGGTVSQQFIDSEGRTVEKKEMMGDELIKHLKYSYDGLKCTGTEVLIGEEEGIEYNELGQLVKSTTYMGTKNFEYDDKGYISKVISINPYTMGLEEMTVHKIYFKK